MYIIPYEHKVHESEVEKMLISRFMPTHLINDLPQHGLIAIEGDTPIAVGFIRMIEGPYAMLDSYITNSEVDSKIRDRALNIITNKLLKWAKTANINKVLAFSCDENTIKRAESHGFITFPDHLFQLIQLK